MFIKVFDFDTKKKVRININHIKSYMSGPGENGALIETTCNGNGVQTKWFVKGTPDDIDDLIIEAKTFDYDHFAQNLERYLKDGFS